MNSFKTFKVNTGKQIVCCNHQGYVIGDAILFYLAENSFNIVGRPPVANWVQFNLEKGGYNATAVRDERSAQNQGRRKAYRFQIQGPNALKVMEKVTGKPVPEIKFFHMDAFTIGGQARARAAPRHGGPARVGAVRPVGRRRRGARRPRRGRPGVRHPAGGRPHLPHVHDRVGLDPVAAAGRLHRRRHEGLPAVAEADELRGDGVAGRQLLLERHHGTTT